MYSMSIDYVCIGDISLSNSVVPLVLCLLAATQVVSNGWEPGSRLVHAEHENYYMIAFQYKCKTCAEEG